MLWKKHSIQVCDSSKIVLMLNDHFREQSQLTEHELTRNKAFQSHCKTVKLFSAQNVGLRGQIIYILFFVMHNVIVTAYISKYVLFKELNVIQGWKEMTACK